jgi:hypothetical protein
MFILGLKIDIYKQYVHAIDILTDGDRNSLRAIAILIIVTTPENYISISTC